MKFCINNKKIKFSFLLVSFLSVLSCTNKKSVSDKREHISSNYSLSDESSSNVNLSENEIDEKIDTLVDQTIDLASNYVSNNKTSVYYDENISEYLDELNKYKQSKSKNLENNYKSLTELINKFNVSNNNTNESREISKNIKELIKVHSELYLKTATNIPKIIHFMWLSGPLGVNQENYIRIWAKKNPDYTINIWYDSEQIFANKSKKIMLELLKNDWLGNLNDVDVNAKNTYKELYKLDNNMNNKVDAMLSADKMIDLQNEFFSFATNQDNSGVSSDDLRIKFLKNIYKRQKILLKLKKVLTEENTLHLDKFKNNFKKFIQKKEIKGLPPDQQREKYIYMILPELKEGTLDSAKFFAKKEMKNIISELEQSFNNIKFKDIKTNKENWKLTQEYNIEMNRRMNWAAASDLARVEVLNQYGGIYLDVDLLPTMKESIFDHPAFDSLKTVFKNSIEKNDNSKFVKLIETAFSELLMNSNVELKTHMRKRGESTTFLNKLIYEINNGTIDGFPSNQYKTQLDSIPDKLKEIANEWKNKSIEELFSNLGDVKLRKGEYSVQHKNNSAIIANPNLDSSESNWLNGLIEMMKERYDEYSRIQENHSGKLVDYKPKNKSAELFFSELNGLKVLTLDKILYYEFRYDSLVSNSQTTLFFSGPAAFMSNIESHYKNAKLMVERSIPHTNSMYNLATEENAESSWLIKENTSEKRIISIPVTNCR